MLDLTTLNLGPLAAHLDQFFDDDGQMSRVKTLPGTSPTGSWNPAITTRERWIIENDPTASALYYSDLAYPGMKVVGKDRRNVVIRVQFDMLGPELQALAGYVDPQEG